MFFGWYVVSGTMIVQMAVVGFFSYAVSLLVASVRAELGVSMEEVMYSLTAGTLFGMVLMPIGGILVDKYPVRWLLTSGLLAFAGGIWILAHTATVWEYVLVFGLTMSVTMSLTGPHATSSTVSRWFTKSRGRALGVSAVGTSLGGVVVPPLFAYWVANDGWRVALENLSLTVLIVVVPLTILSIRGKPSDIGLEPEANDDQSPASDSQHYSTKDILAHPAYWYIGGTLGLLFSVYTAILANLTPYVTEAGLSAADASTLIMLIAIFGFIGKVFFGVIADKVNLKLGLWISIGLVVISFLLLAAEPSFALMAVASITMGLATGGMLPVWGAMLAKVFGLASYGRVMGMMGPLITLLVMPSFPIVGRLYDAYGNYQVALLAFCGVCLLAAALLIPLKLEPSEG
jgi:MFS family permease